MHYPKSTGLLYYPLVQYKLDAKVQDFKIENKAIDTYLFV
jgi:hypothetical protein